MTARSSSALAYDDFLYLTGEAPDIDEKMQASVLRDYTLQGVKTSANSGLAQTSTPYATSNPDRELSLDVTNLTVSGGTASVTDYIAIDQGAGIKKLLVGDLPFSSSASSVASLTGGTNVNVSAATGAVTVNVDTTMTGLTSVTSTDFVGDLTGDVTGDLTGTASIATALAATLGVAGGGTGMTSIAKGGVIVSSAADTFSALLGGVGEDGYVLTYNETADTLTWEPHAGSAGTVSSVAISGTDGIDVDSGSPITTSGTITLGLSGIADAAISSAATWNAKQNALTFGIADTNSVVIDSASVADDDYAKFTASGLEGRNASETKTDLSLDNVENTALSTWAGSTNITTLGTIATGTWEGTTVAVDQGGTGITSIAKGSVLVANALDTISVASGVTDGHVLTYTSASDTVGWGAVPSSGDPAGTAVAMAIALGG